VCIVQICCTSYLKQLGKSHHLKQVLSLSKSLPTNSCMHIFHLLSICMHPRPVINHFPLKAILKEPSTMQTQFPRYANPVQALSLHKLCCKCFLYAFTVHLFLLCKTSKACFVHASIPSQKSCLSFSEIP
jgi:hypothetical protein